MPDFYQWQLTQSGEDTAWVLVALDSDPMEAGGKIEYVPDDSCANNPRCETQYIAKNADQWPDGTKIKKKICVKPGSDGAHACCQNCWRAHWPGATGGTGCSLGRTAQDFDLIYGADGDCALQNIETYDGTAAHPDGYSVIRWVTAPISHAWLTGPVLVIAFVEGAPGPGRNVLQGCYTVTSDSNWTCAGGRLFLNSSICGPFNEGTCNATVPAYIDVVALEDCTPPTTTTTTTGGG